MNTSLISVGNVTTQAAALQVQWLEQLWISIRRCDGNDEPQFARLAGRPMTLDELGRLLPQWQTLSWAQIEDSDLSHGQWTALQEPFRINLYGEPGGRASHAQVMAHWVTLMEGVHEEPAEGVFPMHTLKVAQQVLSVFFRVSRAWGLKPKQEQGLLGQGRMTVYRWRKGVVTQALELDTLTRVSYVMRIYAALEILLPRRERADQWIKQKNAAPLFEGLSALEFILAGDASQTADKLQAVADYLEGECGGVSCIGGKADDA